MSFKAWFRVGASAILSLSLSATTAVAQGHGHGHENQDRDEDDRGRGHGHGHGHGHERYADHDRDIRDWYRDHYDHLPPGLAKRDHLPPGLERQLIVDGTLPPGLQKKRQPCPRELEVMLPPPPPNYVHVVIGGNLVMYNRATLQIGDVFRLDAAF